MQSFLMNEQTVDSRELRNAFGRLAVGVTVTTTQTASGKLEGLTANSFSALSLDPPLVLSSIRQSAPSLPGFLEVSGFALNVLAADQRKLACCLRHRFDRQVRRGALRDRVARLTLSFPAASPSSNARRRTP
jgi:flavin reductase (DIM6/NTAB) family NADH-FMN oxidoreductase RutF